MELQLGLALPNNGGFDLNCNGFRTKEAVERNFGFCFSESNGGSAYKRTFTEDEAHEEVETLPLLIWHGQPNEEDHPKEQRNRSSNVSDGNHEDQNHVVGWPPIKSWRKKVLHQHQYRGGRIGNARMPKRGINGRNSMYVKVKMEGVVIGRKINLRLYHSFQTLTNALMSMFAKYQTSDDVTGYTVLYQDREGDWLLAGDVPWQTFIESAQRMEILRNAH